MTSQQRILCIQLGSIATYAHRITQCWRLLNELLYPEGPAVKGIPQAPLQLALADAPRAELESLEDELTDMLAAGPGPADAPGTAAPHFPQNPLGVFGPEPPGVRRVLPLPSDLASRSCQVPWTF